jgi:hypothetical protein
MHTYRGSYSYSLSFFYDDLSTFQMNLKIKISHSKLISNLSYTQNVRKVGKQNLPFSKICDLVFNYQKRRDCESSRPLSGDLVINDD